MTLRELAEAIDAELVGAAGDAEVLGLTGLEEAASGHITYLADAKRRPEAEAGPALALITSLDIQPSSKPLLRAANPRLAFARALALFTPARHLTPGVHATAVLGAGVEIGKDAAVGAYCVIGDGVSIGPRTQVHPLVSIGPGVRVGEDCAIHPQVTLYEGVQLGARVTIQAGAVLGSRGFGYVFDGERNVPLPHLGTVLIEDEVEIGANVTIDRGTTGATRIGAGTKLDNLVHIAHNVTVGRNCLFAAQVGISGSAIIGEHVILGGQAGVSDHRTLGNHAAAGGAAAVFQDVPDNTIVYGIPARPRAQQLRIDAATLKLPELLRTVRELKKRIEELESRD